MLWMIWTLGGIPGVIIHAAECSTDNVTSHMAASLETMQPYLHSSNSLSQTVLELLLLVKTFSGTELTSVLCLDLNIFIYIFFLTYILR